ncbi:type I-F CRISPR-associated endoribonuclease Cas6/Csy4 [Marinobacter fuscus]|uniref:Type I-F CRISPR-associated endoribonuclease Cas6/Csy4 n=1 Tax=Marinobacter fuscus TaxID=2109942 RepID=A0A2T1KKC7_9GAMM|nr:type I-F CRISPR-associated endoribonuclease Cas6/Csy4 [Marinobacter fuscus]PSF10606.1 type I-F CRISPR-associated endoribonuclease Cas6/Csy4 [Marinobacter fuscus]
MRFYQDITLLPDAEVSLGFLWQKVYQQIHIALVEHKIGDNQSQVAVGFPEYGNGAFPLGRKLRLYASERVQLEQLGIEQYLRRLNDYVHLKSVQDVPDVASYVSFVRHHAKGEARIEKDHQNKARLWAAKSGKPLQECLDELEKSRPTLQGKLPFIWMESQETKKREESAGRRFPLFIKRSEQPCPVRGAINCYGLSHPDNPVSLPAF